MSEQDHHRASDPILASLVDTVIDNSKAISRLAEQWQSAQDLHRQEQAKEHADHAVIGERLGHLASAVDLLNERTTVIPDDQHLEDHAYIAEQRRLLRIRTERAQYWRDFWREAARRIAGEGVTRAVLFILGVLALVMLDDLRSAWDHFLQWVRRP